MAAYNFHLSTQQRLTLKLNSHESTSISVRIKDDDIKKQAEKLVSFIRSIEVLPDALGHNHANCMLAEAAAYFIDFDRPSLKLLFNFGLNTLEITECIHEDI